MKTSAKDAGQLNFIKRVLARPQNPNAVVCDQIAKYRALVLGFLMPKIEEGPALSFPHHHHSSSITTHHQSPLIINHHSSSTTIADRQ